MSRSRVPTMLWRVYGIPAPKSIGLRVIEPGPEKEHTESGLFLGQGVYHSPDMLQELDIAGYVLADAHEKMLPKPGNEPNKTPVVYLTFNYVDPCQFRKPASERVPLIHSIGGLAFAQAVTFTGHREMCIWLKRVFTQNLAVKSYLNRPTGKPAMLGLNIVQASSQSSHCGKFDLHRYTWMEDEAAVP